MWKECFSQYHPYVSHRTKKLKISSITKNGNGETEGYVHKKVVITSPDWMT